MKNSKTPPRTELLQTVQALYSTMIDLERVWDRCVGESDSDPNNASETYPFDQCLSEVRGRCCEWIRELTLWDRRLDTLKAPEIVCPVCGNKALSKFGLLETFTRYVSALSIVDKALHADSEDAEFDDGAGDYSLRCNVCQNEFKSPLRITWR